MRLLALAIDEETRGLADAQFFAGFQKPVHFINTARGPILRPTICWRRWMKVKVLSAGFDVLEYEKSSRACLKMNCP